LALNVFELFMLPRLSANRAISLDKWNASTRTNGLGRDDVYAIATRATLFILSARRVDEALGPAGARRGTWSKPVRSDCSFKLLMAWLRRVLFLRRIQY
jgi:hypothetical protein